jgi:hypothetical protein
MAKVNTQIVVIKFSKLVRDDAPQQNIIPEDLANSLEQVAQELAGDGVIVEVETVEHDGN